ncbi:MAG TPA: orotidine-5'-phosphate decarboxylase [Bacteroidales bacterium]|nr:orotidine-5'-phosphate decarboxylase [Bacteroidales bacterium]
MTYLQLSDEIRRKGSFLCVGLDTGIKLIPEHLHKCEYPLFEFNKAIIEATAPYAVAFKPNTAFYEALGIKGWKQLEMTVRYIKEQHPKTLVIADAKRGDIGNTADMYARCFFENMDCDAVTLAPYMGEDSVRPFLNYEGKWSVVLALTSNRSAEDFETLALAGEKSEQLFEKVLRTASTWGSKENTMFVVGATRPEKLTEIRAICPDHFLLVPGVGAQGGSVEEVAHYGLNDNCGLLVNSSRSIIYASRGEDFAQRAAEEAAKLASKMALLL